MWVGVPEWTPLNHSFLTVRPKRSREGWGVAPAAQGGTDGELIGDVLSGLSAGRADRPEAESTLGLAATGGRGWPGDCFVSG